MAASPRRCRSTPPCSCCSCWPRSACPAPAASSARSWSSSASSRYSSWVAFFAATGMILGAAYMLWLYRRVIFGALVKDTLKGIRDMRTNEMIAFAPLVVLAIVMGVYPSLFLDPMHASVNQLLAQIGVEPAPTSPSAERGDQSPCARPYPRRRRADPVPAARWRLLLLGAFRGEQDGARLLTPLAVLTLLVAALIAAGARQDPRRSAFGGHFVLRRLRRVPQGADPGRRRGRPAAGRSVHARRADRALRVPAAGAVLGARHVHDGLGQQLPRPLHGARAAEPADLRAGRRSTATTCARPRPG